MCEKGLALHVLRKSETGGRVINVFKFILQLQRVCTSASSRIRTDHPGKTRDGVSVAAESRVGYAGLCRPGTTLSGSVRSCR